MAGGGEIPNISKSERYGVVPCDPGRADSGLSRSAPLRRGDFCMLTDVSADMHKRCGIDDLSAFKLSRLFPIPDSWHAIGNRKASLLAIVETLQINIR